MAISIADIRAHPAEAMAALIETVRVQGEEIACLQENLGIALSLIAKMRAAKEPQDPKILDELYKQMIAIGRKQCDFATAARMVNRTKSRILQLKPVIAQDLRFVLTPSESHSQKMLIRLRTD